MATKIEPHEVEAYVVAAARGDILPAVLRLASERSKASWTDRATMVLAVGPACREEALDTACEFMPRATEPLLLRAARAIRRASSTRTSAERSALLDAARNDLASASVLDPMDATVRVLLAELAGPRAWAYAA